MEKKQIPLKVAKIGLIGDTKVGKYSLCQSYVGLEFKDISGVRIVLKNLILKLFWIMEKK